MVTASSSTVATLSPGMIAQGFSGLMFNGAGAPTVPGLVGNGSTMQVSFSSFGADPVGFHRFVTRASVSADTRHHEGERINLHTRGGAERTIQWREYNGLEGAARLPNGEQVLARLVSRHYDETPPTLSTQITVQHFRHDATIVEEAYAGFSKRDDDEWRMTSEEAWSKPHTTLGLIVTPALLEAILRDLKTQNKMLEMAADVLKDPKREAGALVAVAHALAFILAASFPQGKDALVYGEKDDEKTRPVTVTSVPELPTLPTPVHIRSTAHDFSTGLFFRQFRATPTQDAPQWASYHTADVALYPFLYVRQRIPLDGETPFHRLLRGILSGIMDTSVYGENTWPGIVTAGT